MKFGKYKGKCLSEVPTGYLQNLLKGTKDPKKALVYSGELAQRGEPLVFCKKGKATKAAIL